MNQMMRGKKKKEKRAGSELITVIREMNQNFRNLQRKEKLRAMEPDPQIPS